MFLAVQAREECRLCGDGCAVAFMTSCHMVEETRLHLEFSSAAY